MFEWLLHLKYGSEGVRHAISEKKNHLKENSSLSPRSDIGQITSKQTPRKHAQKKFKFINGTEEEEEEVREWWKRKRRPLGIISYNGEMPDVVKKKLSAEPPPSKNELN